MVTPFSSSGPSRSPSECSFQQVQQQLQQQQVHQQHPLQQQQQHKQQQQQQHKQQPNRSNGAKPDGNKEAIAAAAKAVGKSSGGGASERRQLNGHNPGKQQQQQPSGGSSMFRGQQVQQQRRPQPPPLLSLMSVGLQNKTSLLGFPQPGGVPIAPMEIRTSLMGNPMPILPGGAAAAKGQNVKVHPSARAVATGDVKANGGGSVTEGVKGGRSKGGGGGGKINSGPLVNKSEVNGGANSSKFLRVHRIKDEFKYSILRNIALF